jgi:two-component system, OmpR family, response regulator
VGIGVIGSSAAGACKAGAWAGAGVAAPRQSEITRSHIFRRMRSAAVAIGRCIMGSGRVGETLSNDPSGRAGGHPVTVLVVEDDPTLQRMIAGYFGENNIKTVIAAGRQQMAHQLTVIDVNLVILDLRLGQEDGLDLLREIRSKSDMPVIIITGHRRDEIDRVVGLELGADDYVTKPFNLRELLARVRAVLRRAEGGRDALPRDRDRGGCRFAGWQLDRRNRRLTDPNGAPVPLTKGEYALLLAFLEAPQRPLTREHLLQATRIHEDVYDRSIDVQILRLRRKLERDSSAPRMIQTQRGVGYVFAVRVEPL